MSLNGSRPHVTSADRTDRRPPGTQRAAAARVSSRLISEAVVAGYLRDISQHRRRVAVPESHLPRPTPAE